LLSAKKEARSELSISGGGWNKYGAAASNVLDTSILDAVPAAEHRVPRVHIRDLTEEEFIEKYEKPRLPVIIEGLLDEWQANNKWDPASLLQRMPDAMMKVGTDDDGYPVRMKLKHYLMYVDDDEHGRQDDSPMYIFDGTFSEKKGTIGLLQVRETRTHRLYA
jgi:histone arginine demethylase JMJD6